MWWAIAAMVVQRFYFWLVKCRSVVRVVVDLVGGVGVNPVLTSNSSATPLMLLLCGMSRRP